MQGVVSRGSAPGAVAVADSGENHGSLMMFTRAVGVMRLDVVDAGRVVVVTGASVVVRVVRLVVVVVVVVGLLRLTLAVLLVLHASVLEPYLDLALGQVQIARQLPALLL